MSSLVKNIGGRITKGALKQHLATIEPQDPLYEETINSKGKKKRVRRQLPPGLSDRDQKILLALKRRAHYLDKGINLCGFRVGWTFFIGLIPGLGDLVDALLNYNLVVKKAKQADLPDWLVTQMLINNMISLGVGFIPLLGDVVLGIWKANSRNVHIVEEFLALRGQENIQNGVDLNPPPTKKSWFGGGSSNNKTSSPQPPNGSSSILPGPGGVSGGGGPSSHDPRVQQQGGGVGAGGGYGAMGTTGH